MNDLMFKIAKGLTGVNRPARDQWLRAIPLNIAEGNGKQSLKDKNRFFEIARRPALECASIHDVLRVCDAIDEESNRRGKSGLKRIVSMLTRLIQRQTVAEGGPMVILGSTGVIRRAWWNLGSGS